MLGWRRVKLAYQKSIRVDGTEALVSKVSAVLEGQPFYSLIGVLRKLDCIFDFVLLSPQPLESGLEQSFFKVIRSFHYVQD